MIKFIYIYFMWLQVVSINYNSFCGAIMNNYMSNIYPI